MDPVVEVTFAILTISALAGTILLRRDLEEHGLHLWVYAGMPLMTAAGIGIIFHDSLPEDIADLFSYWIAAIGIAAMFVGVLLALIRGD